MEVKEINTIRWRKTKANCGYKSDGKTVPKSVEKFNQPCCDNPGEDLQVGWSSLEPLNYKSCAALGGAKLYT